ncbi:MAG TPA: transposase family protein [Dehalococcoidia bacterium]|nr:transposase family protein [Dehalococcoidia bacterium]
MTRLTVHEYAAALRPRYRAAKKGAKGRTLDEFCQTAGLHRKAAIRLLNRPFAALRAGSGQARAVLPGRPRRYGPEVAEALAKLWEVGDRMCGKLLASVIPDLLSALERHGELPVTPEVRASLLCISPSTIDRLLRKYRTGGRRQPKRQSAAETTLKGQIPIRTWSEWQGVAPGSLQADLVLHCGERTEGFFLTTLTAVDVATGWTELQPVWGMGKQRVGTAMHHVRQRLPFPLKAIHTDNGGEFINHLLAPWCVREKIGFTRGRSYRKNDQAYVEQRNWFGVRRQVGYERYSSQVAYQVLHQLYALLRLQLNFFRPISKLVSKERQGARVRKQYDRPRTPYQRLLDSGILDEAARDILEDQFLAINPAQLRRRTEQTLRRLWALADRHQAAPCGKIG